MTTLLPKDADNNIIPALRLRDGGAHTINAGTTAASNTVAFDPDTKVISLYATVPVYIAFGDSGITATNSDHFIPAGIYYDIAIAGGGGKGPHHSFISALAVSDTGAVYISEKE